MKKNGKGLPSKFKMYPLMALVATVTANAMANRCHWYQSWGTWNSFYDSVCENKEPPEALEPSWLGHSLGNFIYDYTSHSENMNSQG